MWLKTAKTVSVQLISNGMGEGTGMIKSGCVAMGPRSRHHGPPIPTWHCAQEDWLDREFSERFTGSFKPGPHDRQQQGVGRGVSTSIFPVPGDRDYQMEGLPLVGMDFYWQP